MGNKEMAFSSKENQVFEEKGIICFREIQNENDWISISCMARKNQS